MHAARTPVTDLKKMTSVSPSVQSSLSDQVTVECPLVHHETDGPGLEHSKRVLLRRSRTLVAIDNRITLAREEDVGETTLDHFPVYSNVQLIVSELKNERSPSHQVLASKPQEQPLEMQDSEDTVTVAEHATGGLEGRAAEDGSTACMMRPESAVEHTDEQGSKLEQPVTTIREVTDESSSLVSDKEGSPVVASDFQYLSEENIDEEKCFPIREGQSKTFPSDERPKHLSDTCSYPEIFSPTEDLDKERHQEPFNNGTVIYHEPHTDGARNVLVIPSSSGGDEFCLQTSAVTADIDESGKPYHPDASACIKEDKSRKSKMGCDPSVDLSRNAGALNSGELSMADCRQGMISCFAQPSAPPPSLRGIDWSKLHSRQGRYARCLKACRTNIGEDNRMAIAFDLPSTPGVAVRDRGTVQLCQQENVRESSGETFSESHGDSFINRLESEDESDSECRVPCTARREQQLTNESVGTDSKADSTAAFGNSPDQMSTVQYPWLQDVLYDKPAFCDLSPAKVTKHSTDESAQKVTESTLTRDTLGLSMSGLSAEEDSINTEQLNSMSENKARVSQQDVLQVSMTAIYDTSEAALLSDSGLTNTAAMDQRTNTSEVVHGHFGCQDTDTSPNDHQPVPAVVSMVQMTESLSLERDVNRTVETECDVINSLRSPTLETVGNENTDDTENPLKSETSSLNCEENPLISKIGDTGDNGDSYNETNSVTGTATPEMTRGVSSVVGNTVMVASGAGGDTDGGVIPVRPLVQEEDSGVMPRPSSRTGSGNIDDNLNRTGAFSEIETSTKCAKVDTFGSECQPVSVHSDSQESWKGDSVFKSDVMLPDSVLSESDPSSLEHIGTQLDSGEAAVAGQQLLSSVERQCTEDMKTALGSVLRRQVTNIDLDNRLAFYFSMEADRGPPMECLDDEVEAVVLPELPDLDKWNIQPTETNSQLETAAASTPVAVSESVTKKVASGKKMVNIVPRRSKEYATRDYATAEVIGNAGDFTARNTMDFASNGFLGLSAFPFKRPDPFALAYGSRLPSFDFTSADDDNMSLGISSVTSDQSMADTLAGSSESDQFMADTLAGSSESDQFMADTLAGSSESGSQLSRSSDSTITCTGIDEGDSYPSLDSNDAGSHTGNPLAQGDECSTSIPEDTLVQMVPTFNQTTAVTVPEDAIPECPSVSQSQQSSCAASVTQSNNTAGENHSTSTAVDNQTTFSTGVNTQTANTAVNTVNTKTADTAVSTKPTNPTVDAHPTNAAADTQPTNTAVDSQSANTAVNPQPTNTAVNTQPANTAVETQPASTAVDLQPTKSALDTQSTDTAIDTQTTNTAVSTQPISAAIGSQSTSAAAATWSIIAAAVTQSASSPDQVPVTSQVNKAKLKNVTVGKVPVTSDVPGDRTESFRGVSPASRQVSQPTGHVSQPSRQLSQPSRQISQPTDHLSQPSRQVSQPIDHVSQSSRDVPQQAREAADQLSFHAICGPCIELQNEQRTAHRRTRRDGTEVFTDRPVRRYEMFEVRVDEENGGRRLGSLQIGVIAQSPLTVKLPMPNLRFLTGTWMLKGRSLSENGKEIRNDYGPNLDSELKVGDHVGVVVTDTGRVHFFLNGLDMGPAFRNVTEPVYGIVSLCGRTARISAIEQPISHVTIETCPSPPRLCHLWKQPGQDLFGLQMKLERGEFYIEGVTAGSGAEAGGLREGDRVIEVMGKNVELETLEKLSSLLPESADHRYSSLLVVDEEGEKFYRQKMIAISGKMIEVKVIGKPPSDNSPVVKRNLATSTTDVDAETLTGAAGIIPEGVFLDEDMWDAIIDVETHKLFESTPPQDKARCSVLLVDISASMAGEPWLKLKSGVEEFLNGLKQIHTEHGLQEHVVMVTCGHETCISVPVTDDYQRILDALELVKPGGPTPLVPAIILCILQFVRKGFTSQSLFKMTLHGFPVSPRIILFSDGGATPSGMIQGPDVLTPEQAVVVNEEVLEKLEDFFQGTKCKFPVSCVAVGDHINQVVLDALTNLSGGKLVQLEDVRVLTRSTYNHLVASQIGRPMLDNIQTDSLDTSLFQSLAKTVYPEATASDLSEMVDVLERAHKKLQKAQKQEAGDDVSDSDSDIFSDSDNGEEDNHMERSDLPSIATRVAAGPENERGSELLGQGLITGHSVKHEKRVFVQWDCGLKLVCRYGEGDAYDVIPNEDLPSVTTGDPVKIGSSVRRGPDWQWHDQDSGADGVGVIYDIYRHGIVQVRWSSGVKGSYRCGYDGMYDVVVCDPADPDGNKARTSKLNRKNKMVDDKSLAGDCSTDSQLPGPVSGRSQRETRNMAMSQATGDYTSIKTLLQPTSVANPESEPFTVSSSINVQEQAPADDKSVGPPIVGAGLRNVGSPSVQAPSGLAAGAEDSGIDPGTPVAAVSRPSKPRLCSDTDDDNLMDAHMLKASVCQAEHIEQSKVVRQSHSVPGAAQAASDSIPVNPVSDSENTETLHVTSTSIPAATSQTPGNSNNTSAIGVPPRMSPRPDEHPAMTTPLMNVASAGDHSVGAILQDTSDSVHTSISAFNDDVSAIVSPPAVSQTDAPKEISGLSDSREAAMSQSPLPHPASPSASSNPGELIPSSLGGSVGNTNVMSEDSEVQVQDSDSSVLNEDKKSMSVGTTHSLSASYVTASESLSLTEPHSPRVVDHKQDTLKGDNSILSERPMYASTPNTSSYQDSIEPGDMQLAQRYTPLGENSEDKEIYRYKSRSHNLQTGSPEEQTVPEHRVSQQTVPSSPAISQAACSSFNVSTDSLISGASWRGSISELSDVSDTGEVRFQWLWKATTSGEWQAFPASQNSKIERSFRRRPGSTHLTTIGENSYRIVFPKMKMRHLQTKETFDVMREEPSSMASQQRSVSQESLGASYRHDPAPHPGMSQPLPQTPARTSISSGLVDRQSQDQE